MQARDLAIYFAKKIGKPIPYTHLERRGEGTSTLETNYVVEPVAVADDVLHALVTLKSRTSGGGGIKLPVKRSLVSQEIEIPIENGDSATLVLTMAVAGADLESYPEKLQKNKIIHDAYFLLQDRLAKLVDVPLPPRM